MKKEEFIQSMKDIGLNIKILNSYLDKMNLIDDACGIYQDHNEWIVYVVGERATINEWYKGTEDATFEEFNKLIFFRLFMYNYCTDLITTDIIKITKQDLFTFFKSRFDLNDAEINSTWKNLTHNFSILNEVKYFSVHNEFLPKEDAYTVEGYTAQDLFETTYLTEIGAYNYLVYLQEHPKEGLEALAKGLPKY
jgi:uncharacterized protein YxjI